MLTNECMFGYHDDCMDDFGTCDCLHHFQFNWDEEEEDGL